MTFCRKGIFFEREIFKKQKEVDLFFFLFLLEQNVFFFCFNLPCFPISFLAELLELGESIEALTKLLMCKVAKLKVLTE